MSISRMLIALGLTCATAWADVVVIDPGGGPGDQLLKQALAAAAPGDVLLLEPGDYEQMFFGYVIDKGITLLPASADARITLGPVQIQNIPARQSAVLRGFDVNPLFDGGTPLVISHVEGTVWIEDCHFAGSQGTPGLGGGPGIAGGNAANVHEAHAIFRHCSFTGGAGGDAELELPATQGGTALHTGAHSQVAIYDCTLVGGDFGSGAFFSAGFPAGPALATTYSDVTVSGCTLTGGREAADNDALPGTSGSAIVTKDRTTVRVLQSVLLPGAVQGLGTQAPAVDGAAWTVEMLAEPARELVLPSLVQVGQPAILFLDGEPGDLALIVMSSEAWAGPAARLEGTLALLPGSFGPPVIVGVLTGPDGQLSVPYSIGALPPGMEETTQFVQGLFQDADGASLGGASAITWIAAGP